MGIPSGLEWVHARAGQGAGRGLVTGADGMSARWTGNAFSQKRERVREPPLYRRVPRCALSPSADRWRREGAQDDVHG
ncbi:hypothetical protein GCM10010255_16440 [Streptomyces coeruleofuscus]|uniref:Uncharacterized protein n=1 Tax=Streptomyces coeruleofuscus TaxID=66879 RepID=A0ABN3HVN0_9ACTN